VIGFTYRAVLFFNFGIIEIIGINVPQTICEDTQMPTKISKIMQSFLSALPKESKMLLYLLLLIFLVLLCIYIDHILD